ncbi:Tyrosinase [Fusarium keratoplasticum]|uniref:Tyrosinase n=1 Tax=Fusarium keratoplasticum TaxID=1328300 RepID=A0ACC0R369_9HYPO|nr:Tyrosinase [Fusarium keratoplasticum]KAI8674654.1 Tyrosinase [Fusarium keratoplasticum]
MAESKLHNTYAITGIPVKNVETKTKDIPYAPGTPIRREINELFPSEDPLTRKQWTLFILGLEKFKKMPVDERESYFQVAGIHGYPQTSWDGAPDPPKDPDWNPPKSKPWGANPYGGYCHHNTIAFPTWHRPYMLLYEQIIWENMKKIIKDDWKLVGEQEKEWTAAANSWRLPYWDWAQRQTYEGYENSFSLPYACILDHVPIYPPTGDTACPNPLVNFVNPEKDAKGDPLPFGNMPPGKKKWDIHKNATEKGSPSLPWDECSGTSRYGVFSDEKGGYRGLTGVNNFNTANLTLNAMSDTTNWYNPYRKEDPDRDPKFEAKPPGTLADSINRLFSSEYNDTWGSFSSTKWWAESAQKFTTGYLSLEYIHNNVHNVTGGGDLTEYGLGHMSDVPVAAFDPIFWLHHCNIDRLLSMWQALNWNKWWDTKEPPPPDEKDETGKPRTNLPDPTPCSPLLPFHNVETDKPDQEPDKGFWTSEGVRDWTKLGYTYDILTPAPISLDENGALNEEVYKAELLAKINSTYTSTGEYYRKLYEDEEITNEEFFGPHNTEFHTWNDYIINVIYDRYALKGSSYVIEFWLGGRDNDRESTFRDAENLIGSVYCLAGMTPSSTIKPGGCANCGSQRDNKVLSRGQVTLTIPLITQALNKNFKHLKSVRGRYVIEYLKNHLHWRFVPIGGGPEKPASDFPDTVISVLRGTGKYVGKSKTKKDLPPKYADYKLQYGPTENKPAGLTSDDEVLGKEHESELDFRTF